MPPSPDPAGCDTAPPGRNRAHNSAWMLGGQLAGKGAFFASLMLYSRSLGDAEFGRLVFSVALGVFVLFLSDMGATLITTRRVAAAQAAAATALGEALQLRAVLGVSAYLLLLAFGAASGYSQHQLALLALVGAGVILEGFCETYFAIFRASERMHPEGIARLAEGAVCLGLAAVISRSGMGVGWAGLAYLLRSAVSLAICIQAARSLGIRPGMGSDRGRLALLFRESLPLGVMGLLLVSTQRLDNLLVMNYSGEAAVGAYQRCYRIYEALILVVAPTLLPGALFPELCRAVRGSRARARGFIRNMTEAFLAVAAAACIVLLAAGLDLPRLVWGPGFLGGLDPAQVLLTYRIFVLAVPVTYLFHVCLATVLAQEKQSIVLPLFGAAVLIQFAGNLLLIPRLGLVAAASMQLLTVFFCTAVMWLKVRGVTGSFLGSVEIARLLASVVAAGAAAVLLPLPDVTRIPAGAGVFVFLWLSLGGLGSVRRLFGSSHQGEIHPCPEDLE